MVQVKIDYDKCKGCSECIKTCRFGVLEWLDEQPIVVSPNKCGKCMECIENCPEDAITIKEP
ncbi:MAG: 4Fe-4S binding protein [Candidatus Helarchaeota archaeon]|nr:4Fe-4S binding protein [Candidatus Helarchaeota archaeon]